MNSISNLYPQYHYAQERRQNNIPVAIDRRSGQDRRTEPRVVMDSRLTRDIYDVKGKLSKIENFGSRILSQQVTMQNPSFAARNNLTQDQFVRNTKPDSSEVLRQEAKQKEKSDTAFKMGMLATALAGVAAMSFLGAAGAVIAVGTAFYIGSKVLKTAVENEIQDNKNSRNF